LSLTKIRQKFCIFMLPKSRRICKNIRKKHKSYDGWNVTEKTDISGKFLSTTRKQCWNFWWKSVLKSREQKAKKMTTFKTFSCGHGSYFQFRKNSGNLLRRQEISHEKIWSTGRLSKNLPFPNLFWFYCLPYYLL